MRFAIPLGVIKGSAETLNRKLENSNPLASELAGYISSEVNRASALVTRFLDFARPLRTETRLQQVTELIDQALKSVADQWKGGPVVVEREYQKDLPPVPLDENLCEQVFLNLVQNAYEAMGSEGGTFRVEVSGARSNGRKGVQVRLRRYWTRRSGGNARADFQSFCDHQENRRRTGAFHRFEDCG